MLERYARVIAGEMRARLTSTQRSAERSRRSMRFCHGTSLRPKAMRPRLGLDTKGKSKRRGKAWKLQLEFDAPHSST